MLSWHKMRGTYVLGKFVWGRKVWENIWGKGMLGVKNVKGNIREEGVWGNGHIAMQVSMCSSYEL